MRNVTVVPLWVSFKKIHIQRQGKGSSSDAAGITPPRLMAARKLMADRVARMAAELPKGDASSCYSTVTMMLCTLEDVHSRNCALYVML